MTHVRITSIAILVLAAASLCAAEKQAEKSITVVLNDGQQKHFSLSDVSRIDFTGASMVVTQSGHQENIPVSSIVRIDFNPGATKSLPLGLNHFVGKWEFGTGVGNQTFFVTLGRDGHAHKSRGSGNGTWEVVGGEARIKWDDGWRDVIRKVGDKHQKFAYEPGKSLTDDPSNVTDAKTLNSEPI